MEAMGVAEAKRRFSEIVNRVLAGERFVVTRRGRPAVVLSRPDDERDAEGDAPDRYPGILTCAGILDGAMTDEDVDAMVEHIYAERLRARGRELPHEWTE